MDKGLIRGGELTSHDSGNDILYTVKETGQQVLIEGDEYHLCKAALMNNEIHEYKNKTNKEILEDIYTRSSCMVKEGEANVGDFIICKLAVRDKKKRNLTGTIAEIISIMQKEHGCRVVDGAEYEKMKKGGYVRLSKTPAPKKERIYGSKTNPERTSQSGKSAKSIKFSESTLNTIKNKVEEHNKKHPEKKITVDIAKAVVRRGMGAYSSTHRPTIKGGKPNSRVAWGIARLNAFIYKVVNGKSKSGRYSEDNDLLDELGIKHQKFADGGSFQPPYPINASGGYDYKGEAKETAKKVDLLTLPKNVNGTHCGNCFFFEQGICVHKGIMLPVTDRMCCSVWDNSNSERSYEKNLQKDKGEIKKDIQTFPKNKDGGYTYSGEALKIAEKFDLITLPKNIEGTNCANCSWYTPYKDGGFCFRSNILLPVTAKMSCAYWNSLSVKRDWGFFEQGGEINKNLSPMEIINAISNGKEAVIQDYYGIDIFEKGGEIKAKNIITEKIGLNEENASFLIEQSPKFAIWMADNILKDVMKKIESEYKTDELLGKQIPKLTQPFLKEKALEEINRFNFINRNYRTQIRLILDWLQHPITPTQNLRELSIDSAFEKAQIFHEELKVIGGDIDFKEAEGNIVLKNYPKNSEGLSYYWVLIPKNFCELESSRMGHCGRTGYGNILISLRSVKPYGSGHTISDSHVTIAYGNSDGYFYQVKGKKNQKPSEKYYEYIYDLIVSMLSKDLGLESLDFLSQEINKLNVAIENIESEFNKKNNEINERGFQIATIDVIAFTDAKKILTDKKEILENKLSKIEQLVEVGFGGFGSEYSTSQDYGWADMTFEQFSYLIKLKPELANEINVNDLSKEQVKVIYELSPDTFKGLVGEIVLYENDLGEAPKTTFILKMDCNSVGSLLKENEDIAEKIVCGEFYEIYDSYFRSEQEIIDYILDDINDKNEKLIIERISKITGLSIEQVAETGIQYYLSEEYLQEDDSIEYDFSGIFNAINRAYISAEESDFYDYMYKELKDSLSEYGNVIKMNDDGIEIEVDLNNYLSYKEIKEIAENLETDDLEYIFNEELNRSIELSNFRFDYSPSADYKIFNEILAEEDLEYKKGGAIKSKKQKISTSSFKMPSRKIYEYAEKIRKNYPEIWDMGGNVFGNEAYKNLEKVIKRGYWKPEEEWMYKKWQAFMARHEGDFRIAGVIANLKWLNWVGKGEAYSKSVIEDEIKEIESKKMAYGGSVSNEVSNFERGLRMLVANTIFNGEFHRRFKHQGKTYRIDFLIVTENNTATSASMLIFDESGQEDIVVLDMPFNFETFDFDYEPYYNMFGKPMKYDKGGNIGSLFGDSAYPSFIIPSSYFIPQSVKDELANKKTPKSKYNFPFTYSLEAAEDVFKKIKGKDDLRPQMDALYLMGDYVAATDAHKLVFVGMDKKQYGSHWFGYPNADKDNAWVKNVDSESHPFYQIMPISIEKGGYSYQGLVSLAKLNQYLTFILNNEFLINRATYLLKMKYKNSDKELQWIGVNAKFLKEICDLYFKFGIIDAHFYINTPSRAIFISHKKLDEEQILVKQFKNNIFSLLMPIMIQEGNYFSETLKGNLATEDIDYGTGCGIYYDLSQNATFDILGKPDNLLSLKTILDESEFQFNSTLFNKIYNAKKKQYGKTLIEIVYQQFLKDFTEEKGLKDKKYSEMSLKELKLAVALGWSNGFLL